VGGLGAPELLIILVIFMLIFGAAKLPKLARSLGESSREFKKGLAEGANAADEETKPDAKS
jgi:sec-independent protein translocase protein TatA